jgi:hypothetical protein
MNSNICVSIPTELFLDLCTFLKTRNDSRDPVLCIADAIDYWLQNAEEKPELLSVQPLLGYQWKNLFMPSGTELRMSYRGSYKYAKVDGDQIIYQGVSVTPSTLANTIAGSSRNAWRDLWIRLPGEPEWRLANDFRVEEISSED